MKNKKIDLCELNFQINQVRDMTDQLTKRAITKKYDEGKTLELKNRIRVGALAELAYLLIQASNLVAKAREFPVDDIGE
jgi:hypothetical protein